MSYSRYKPDDLFLGHEQTDIDEWGWDGKVWAKPTEQEMAEEAASRGTPQEFTAEPWEVATFSEEADARLFVAAPEMLACLRDALPDLKATADAYGDDGGLSDLIRRCEAAIRRAEGR